MRRWDWLVGVAGLAAALGCSANGKESPVPKGQEAGKPPVAVEVAPSEVRELVEGVDVIGSLAPRFEAVVKAELPGLVAEVQVTEWVRVKKGQPLARMDTGELEAALGRARAAVEAGKASEEAARAAVLEAQVAAERAERELERLRNLKDAGLATQQSLDDAVTAKSAARARTAAAEAQVMAARAQTQAVRDDLRQLQARMAKAVIRSPLDGVVAERTVNVGDMPGDKPIFRLVDNRLLDLTVTVSSKDMGRIKVGQPVSFTTDAAPGEIFEGRVKFINPSVDPVDRSVKVVAEVRNDSERLKGGLFVKGRITTGRRSGVLQVPRSALLSWDVAAGKGGLFVVQEGVARRKDVKTGAALGDSVEISSGLAGGEKVVVRGGFSLKDGDPVAVAPVKGGG